MRILFFPLLAYNEFIHPKVMVRWSNVVEYGIITSDSLQGKYVNAFFLLCLQVFLLSSPDIIACLIGISSDPREKEGTRDLER
jgi:hypothetical protein